MSDENLERITILLQARDRDFARAMDRNNKLIARLNRDGSRNMRQMSTSVETQLTRMSSAAATFGRNFARGLAIGAAGAGIALVSRSLRGAVTELSSLAKAARDTGMDVEELQGLMRGFERETRVSSEQLTNAFVAFNRRAGEALHGTGEMATAARRWGFSVTDANGRLKTQRELLDEIAGIMQRLPSQQERAALGMMVFGDIGRQMASALSGGPDALRAMEEGARAAGDIIESNLIHRAEILDDKMDQLTRSVKTFFQTLALTAAGQSVETPIDTLVRLFGDLERARAALGDDLFEALIAQTGELADDTERAAEIVARGAQTLSDEVRRIANEYEYLVHQLNRSDETRAAAEEFDKIREALLSLRQEFSDGDIGQEEFVRRLADIVSESDALVEALGDVDAARFPFVMAELESFGGLVARLRAAVRALANEADGLPGNMTTGTPLDPSGPLLPGDADMRTSPRPRPAPNNIDFGMPPATGGRGGGGGGAQNMFAGAVEDIQARTRALEMEAAALIAVASSGREYGNAVDFARTKADLLQRAMEAGREITPELEAQIDALAEAYVAAGQAAQEAAAQMEEIQAATERGADAVTDLFMSFTKGSDAAKAALAQLLIQLARVRMQEAILGLGGGKGGGFLSWLGGMLGQRAAGGPVRAGVPYRVNENTPNSEIMVPSRSGGVLNVAQAKDALRGQGGGAPVVNFHVDARGAQAGVAEQIRRQLQIATPQIVTQSVQATHESFREFKPG